MSQPNSRPASRAAEKPNTDSEPHLQPQQEYQSTSQRPSISHAGSLGRGRSSASSGRGRSIGARSLSAGPHSSSESSGGGGRKHRRPRNTRTESEQLPPVGEMADEPIAQTAEQGLSSTSEEVQKKKDDGYDNALKLRLDLNLDIDIQLKAKIRGDITLSLLGK